MLPSNSFVLGAWRKETHMAGQTCYRLLLHSQTCSDWQYYTLRTFLDQRIRAIRSSHSYLWRPEHRPGWQMLRKRNLYVFVLDIRTVFCLRPGQAHAHSVLSGG